MSGTNGQILTDEERHIRDAIVQEGADLRLVAEHFGLGERNFSAIIVVLGTCGVHRKAEEIRNCRKAERPIVTL